MYRCKILTMRVVKDLKSKKDTKQNVTLRLKEGTIEKAGRIAYDNDVSRQKLLESIIEQVLEDKSFVLRVKK